MRILFISLFVFAGCISPPSSTVTPDADDSNDSDVSVTDNDDATAQNNQNNVRDVAIDTTDEPPFFAQVSAGRRHACAITATQMLWCWGDNRSNAVSRRPSEVEAPSLIPNLGRVQKVATGDDFTCVLNDADEVFCWGVNDRNQASSSSDAVVLLPEIAFINEGSLDLKAGDAFVCLKVRNTNSGGVLHCWGDNGRRQSDFNNPQFNSIVPTERYMDSKNYLSFDLGAANVCGRGALSSGLMSCWGSNDFGESRQATCTDCGRSGDIGGDTDQAIQISMGDGYGCGVTDGGNVSCWGNNDLGQRGTSGPVPGKDVVPGVSGTQGQMKISAGASHTCVIHENQTSCWGSPSIAIGRDDGGTEVTAVTLTEPVVLEEIAAGDGFSCGIANGVVYCWGLNDVGQLGRGDGVANTHIGTPINVGF